jgi:hypothetical protein
MLPLRKGEQGVGDRGGFASEELEPPTGGGREEESSPGRRCRVHPWELPRQPVARLVESRASPRLRLPMNGEANRDRYSPHHDATRDEREEEWKLEEPCETENQITRILCGSPRAGRERIGWLSESLLAINR